MPDLIENQFNADVEDQNISRLLQNGFTLHCITENACGKAHGQNADRHTDHDDPELIGKRDGCNNIVDAEDQVH